jgi:hypothetical protein
MSKEVQSAYKTIVFMEQSREAHHHFMTLPFLQTGSNFKLRKKKKKQKKTFLFLLDLDIWWF